MSGRTSPEVAVLMGGMSAEAEVSIASGRACAAALREAEFDVIELSAGPALAEQLLSIKPETIFNALHGRFGEDGTVQGLLEWLRIPYTHSGVRASALAMDKELCKAVFRTRGIPVAPSRLVTKDEAMAGHAMRPPYVIKPNDEGSSVGIYLVHEGSNRPPYLSRDLPELVMVEAYVPGRDLTVTVMGDRPLCVTEILTEGWYDYDAKYAPGGSHHVLPAKLPKDVTQACLDYAVRAHDILGCRGVTRTDFRWDDRRGLEGLYLLEINTQPGMTATSLVPEQAAYCGISFPELCRWILEDASCNR